jgi:membrane protease YdiL (CAAX protease family)
VGVYSLLPVAPALGWPASVVVGLTVAYLGLVAPVVGRRNYGRLIAQVRDGSPKALASFYRRNIARKVLLLVPVGLATFLAPGLGRDQLGLVWPHGPVAAGYLQAAPILLVLAAISTLLYRFRARHGRSVPGQRSFAALIPQTREQRWWALGVAFSAGVVEEVLYRGLLLAAALSAGLSPVAAMVLTSILFGVAHLYQGWPGIVLTAVVGFAMALLVVPTGSLVMAIVVHVLLDVRAFLLVPGAAVSSSPKSNEEPVPIPVQQLRTGPDPGAGPLRPSAPGAAAGHD